MKQMFTMKNYAIVQADNEFIVLFNNEEIASFVKDMDALNYFTSCVNEKAAREVYSNLKG